MAIEETGLIYQQFQWVSDLESLFESLETEEESIGNSDMEKGDP